mgnify:CR=1 FL=1
MVIGLMLRQLFKGYFGGHSSRYIAFYRIYYTVVCYTSFHKVIFLPGSQSFAAVYNKVEPITVVSFEMQATIGLADTFHIQLIDIEAGSTS